MPTTLSCYRCGASLEALSLPLARLDECPACRAQLHVCRMCVHYAPRLADHCDEDDAPDVRDERMANFCDYFKPDPQAYTATDRRAEAAAREQLAALFGADAEPAQQSRDDAAAAPASPDEQAQPDEQARRDAEALFGKR